MKALFKQISLLLAFVLVICTICPNEHTNAQVFNSSNKQVFKVGQNNCVSIEETSTGREVYYYVDGQLIQTAFYDYLTGDITCCEYRKDTKSGQARKSITSNVPRVTKSNIRDYLSGEKGFDSSDTFANGQKGSFRGTNYFTLLKTKVVYIDGIPHYRQLSGYTDQKEYIGGSFFFEHGTEVSVISAIIGFLTPFLIGFIVSGASIIAYALSIRWTVIEYYWKYLFRQTSPTYMDFICSNDFAYRKDRRVEENGILLSPETYYVKSSAEIEYERNDILDYPGFYS